MTDYSKMSIDDLFAWRDQWPAQRTEWNRAELALQKRLAVKYAYLDLAEELREEGIVLLRLRPGPYPASPAWGEAIKQSFRETHASIFSVKIEEGEAK